METYFKINRKKLLIRITSLVFSIFILNFLAMKFHWYFSIWYFDMPMHILGGFWLGLVFFWFFQIKDLSFINISKIILGLLLIGFLWEFFEISVDKIITEKSFSTLDSFSDICFDLVGGFFAIFYFKKRIMKKNINIQPRSRTL